MNIFKEIKIKFFGVQPVAKVSNKILDYIIVRDFGSKADEVKQILSEIKSDSHNGKNRISAAVLKLSNKDFNLIKHYVQLSNIDFRDVISQAEYTRCSNLGFEEIESQNMKNIYQEDWIEYSKWLKTK